jgi:hypothetical protein
MTQELDKATEEQVITELSRDMNISESALGEAEPWEPWESQMCLWSLVIGVGGLVILGTLINAFLLAGK